MPTVKQMPSAPHPPCSPPARVGLDLASVADVREALAGPAGYRYLGRVYTPAERAACAGDPAALAGCFAAKEAAIKVLRPRREDPVAWADIEVRRRPDATVGIELTGPAAGLARRDGLGTLSGSVSSAGSDLVAAVVMAGVA